MQDWLPEWECKATTIAGIHECLHRKATPMTYVAFAEIYFEVVRFCKINFNTESDYLDRWRTTRSRARWRRGCRWTRSPRWPSTPQPLYKSKYKYARSNQQAPETHSEDWSTRSRKSWRLRNGGATTRPSWGQEQTKVLCTTKPECASCTSLLVGYSSWQGRLKISYTCWVLSKNLECHWRMYIYGQLLI